MNTIDRKPVNPNSLAKDKALGMIFPCMIGVKIFISNQAETEELLKEFVDSQLDKNELVDWSSRASSGGKYLAITAMVNTPSREHVDAFYQALYDYEHVIMTI